MHGGGSGGAELGATERRSVPGNRPTGGEQARAFRQISTGERHQLMGSSEASGYNDTVANEQKEDEDRDGRAIGSRLRY